MSHKLFICQNYDGKLPYMQINTSICYDCYIKSICLYRVLIFYIRIENKKYALLDIVKAWFF